MRNWDKDIELRSDAVREIIGKTPSWLVRWGTLILTAVILSLVLGSVWFRYPDRIVSKISLSSDQPPVEMVAKNDGYLARLLVTDGQLIQEGMILGYLESSVGPSFTDDLIFELDSIPFWITDMDTMALLNFANKERVQAGELKEYVSALNNAIRGFVLLNQLNRTKEKLNGLEQELIDTKVHYNRLFEQRLLREKDLKLAEKLLDRQKGLFEGGAISEAEFDKSTQETLQRQFQFEESRSGLSSTKIQLDQLQQEIVDLRLTIDEERHRQTSVIEDGIVNLKGAIAEWELNYVFRSPVSGVVSLTRFWAENQKITRGDRVLTIIQTTAEQVIGRLEMPVAGSGKVRIGQRVLIKLDRFPYMEYGMIFGEVRAISAISDQDVYAVEVAFPQGLKTSYHFDLEMSPGMTGRAEIITDNLSFLVRIVNPLKALISGNRRLN